MKIGHAADLHFGTVTHGQPGPGGVNTRILDVERCWSAAVDAFLDAEVDLVIVAGDIFHSPHPDAESLARFAKHLRRLTCGVVMIAGNHERAAHEGRSCVLEAFRDIQGSWRQVSTKPEVLEVADVRIATLPSVSRHRLASLMGGSARADVDAELNERLQRILDQLALSDPDVLTLHWPIQGSMLSSEADIAIIPEPVIPLAALEGPWQFVGAGHIHRSQIFGTSAVGYSGSIDRMNFGEEAEAKGVLIWDEVSAGFAPRWVEVPATRFVTIDPGIEQFTDLDVEEAIVRIRSDTDDWDTAQIRGHLEFHGARSVVFDLKRESRTTPRTAQITEDVDPLAGLDQWMDLKDVPEDDRPRLRSLAADLMEGGS